MKSISGSELKEVLQAGEASYALIDVREPGEYAAGHITGAENIPLGDIQKAAFDLKEFDTVYVYCRSGGRSSLACQLLEAAGVNSVNVEGGTIAWNSIS